MIMRIIDYLLLNHVGVISLVPVVFMHHMADRRLRNLEQLFGIYIGWPRERNIEASSTFIPERVHEERSRFQNADYPRFTVVDVSCITSIV